MFILHRILLAAAEKLKWPMPVDYAAASFEDRREFEASFINLLKLQEMRVIPSHFTILPLLIHIALVGRRFEPRHPQTKFMGKMVYILYKH